MNKISVITVNYNDRAGLAKTIESVAGQTLTPFEFIIIDGGSNDGSKELIEQNQHKISYWISEKDNGIYNAMNKGIKAATGDFIIFMNGGDCFYNNSVLEETAPELAPEFDIYYGNCYKVKSNNSQRLKTYPEKLNFSFFYSSSLNHQSAFIRRSLFDKYFYYNENFKIASDWEFFVYAICHANVPSKYLNKAIALYDFTGISSNPEFSEIFQNEKNESLQKFFPAFVDDYRNIKELTSKRYLQVQHIKKYKFAFKFLKAVMNLILIFLPKMKKI
ncbi:MAG TPA: glycosyltransferase family 2 protein [Flavobacterium sp.]|nr:glycosyltransferase family 2 protein [Flavobacterium sp.]